jgi:hypothetical protein
MAMAVQSAVFCSSGLRSSASRPPSSPRQEFLEQEGILGVRPGGLAKPERQNSSRR